MALALGTPLSVTRITTLLVLGPCDSSGVQEKKPLRPGAANAIESEILTLLSDRHRWEHSTIKENLIEAGHGNSSDSHFGQSVQGTLLSLRTRGLVDLPERGVWEITEKGISGP